MSNALHHLHKRKRIHVQHEEYPHPNLWKRMLDHATMAVGVLAPIMTFTQAWKIWETKSSADLSLWTWIAFFIASLVWTIYGIVHREKTVTISQGLYIIGTALVLIGIAIF